jgi:hypothetical protein
VLLDRLPLAQVEHPAHRALGVPEVLAILIPDVTSAVLPVPQVLHLAQVLEEELPVVQVLAPDVIPQAAG